MSYGTSDSTVISSPNPEAHNLNTTIASAAPRDDGSPATINTTTPKNRQFVRNVKDSDIIPGYELRTLP